MSLSTNSRKSLRIRFAASACCVMSFFLAAAPICSAQEGDDARAKRTAELDAKVDEVKGQFDTLKARLKEATAQAKSNLSAELDIASRDLAKAFDERESVLQEGIAQWTASLDDKWKELEQQGRLTESAAAKKLDELRQSWNASADQLRQSHRQRVDHYRKELAAIEEQVASASDELNATWIARRTDARKQYERTAASMRQSYHEAIKSLEKEVNRLQAGAEKASEENRAKFATLADSLSEKANVLYQELQASYQDTAEKADRYLKQTEAKLSQAGVEMKGRIQKESDQVSAAVCELRAELTACCEQYGESLDRQLTAAKKNAASAEGAAKRRWSETERKLRTQREQAAKQIADAYEMYVAALTADIDHMKQRLSGVDEKAKAALIDMIERRQADLERAKQKLQ